MVLGVGATKLNVRKAAGTQHGEGSHMLSWQFSGTFGAGGVT